MTSQVAGGSEFLVVSPWWVDEMARAARHAEIDRMARAARRHIRYERVKALQMVVRFPNWAAN
jgi:butyrate kinase